MLKQKWDTLLIEQIDPHILIIRFNREEVCHAINFKMMQELREIWQILYSEGQALRCIILTGSNQIFCAGADLKARKDLSLKAWRAQHTVLQQAMLGMIDCPIPIIAAVNGAAFGGGLELVLASDFAYASKDAEFAQSEVKLGLMPGALGTQHLPRACGLNRAKELTLTGERFTAQEAFAWGIINKVCAPPALLDEVIAVAKKISENAPLAVKLAKKSLNMSQQLDVKLGYFFELASYYQLLPSKDREEGIKAFNEKRKPIFTGE